MAWRIVAWPGCENGPCPTFYQDGQVIGVQGYRDPTTGEPVTGVPAGEAVIYMSAAELRHLVSQLPPGP